MELTPSDAREFAEHMDQLPKGSAATVAFVVDGTAHMEGFQRTADGGWKSTHGELTLSSRELLRMFDDVAFYVLSPRPAHEKE